MSAVAVKLDPSFGMGPRSSFAWPDAFDSPSSAFNMLGQDFASMLPPVSESSVSPTMSYRTMSASPPRTTFTQEQRELKRQRDRVRRDSRASTRMRGSYANTTSSSSTASSSSPPLSIIDSMPVGVYGAAPPSILSDPVSYQPPYSPPLHDAHSFSSPYPQSLSMSYNMPMDYAGTYAAPSDFGLAPRVAQDQHSMMYRVPPTDSSSNSHNHNHNHNHNHSGSSSSSSSVVGEHGSGHVRVVQGRPKPRCWEHGCNGRQFSTFSNLLRHQREKSGQATKATCPNCGAEFTRTTARNGHLLHDKCKQRRSS